MWSGGVGSEMGIRDRGSGGACRQCAVRQYKDKDDNKGVLVMSCMTPAADQTRIDIDDEEARAFRSRLGEWSIIHI